ncbi:MAG: ABC transporter ATP-binding protein [Defluviitaleaceae bacterium]|nr:ABC transporter ATP-binding protein [Defluviitaleaceae bacterium]
MREILRFQNVSLTYQAENGEVEALAGINFVVYEGQLVSIIGPSGCGKSTILSLISGLEMPTGGQIYVNGEAVKGVNGKTGYMLQKDNLLDWRTIRGNVLLGLEILGRPGKTSIAYADSLLRAYGLWEFKDKRPSQLSGGMRQRAALIRTLATRPALLLLDEAFSALDYQTRLVVADDVCGILRREQKTAVMVTHDISEGISMADRVIVLSKRPGYVKHDIPLVFENETVTTPLKRRESPAFREYFNLIWKALDVNV